MIRLWGAMAAHFGVAMFFTTVLTLHLLQSDYDPTNQLMSELALGAHGKAMIFAFGGLAIALFGVQSAIGALGAMRHLRLILIAASICFLTAGLFPLGATSDIHITAIAIAFVLTVLAMYLFPSGASRAAVAAPRAISWTLAGGVALSVALGHSLLPMGLAQRLAAACILIWLTVLGCRLRRQ